MQSCFSPLSLLGMHTDTSISIWHETVFDTSFLIFTLEFSHCCPLPPHSIFSSTPPFPPPLRLPLCILLSPFSSLVHHSCLPPPPPSSCCFSFFSLSSDSLPLPSPSSPSFPHGSIVSAMVVYLNTDIGVIPRHLSTLTLRTEHLEG